MLLVASSRAPMAGDPPGQRPTACRNPGLLRPLALPRRSAMTTAAHLPVPICSGSQCYRHSPKSVPCRED
eukprot:673993-Pyramimonas_sp.AAC.1